MAQAAIAMEWEYDGQGRAVAHRWRLPTDAASLRAILTDMFTHHWDQFVFGPILDGIAYEWTCPGPPDRIEMAGGYLTIGFDGPHFHLCIAPNPAIPDIPEAQARQQRRLPGAASLFRMLDPHGAPNSWGFDLRNGAGEPLMAIYFSNPFVLSGDRLADTPDWSRLAMWRAISGRYLGLPPDPFDETSHGFSWGEAA